MIPFSLFIFILVQSSFANLDDSFLENSDAYNLYPDDLLDLEDNEIDKRDNQFLRFGRSGNYDDEYEDADDAKVGKKNLKNDHFIRFGRGGHDGFLRFGRDQNKPVKDKAIYLRFGRSTHVQNTSKTRPKRETQQDRTPKRKDAFLRFGKSSDFMRFGRNYEAYPKPDDGRSPPRSFDDVRLSANSPLALLLAQLMTRKRLQEQRHPL
ncbi:hypothetical protein JTB14_004848 [Gonioctena quinquepunctata]|nr:hypothetical protein JTB14_004848 [Gonioctena quinquepunctata]